MSVSSKVARGFTVGEWCAIRDGLRVLSVITPDMREAIIVDELLGVVDATIDWSVSREYRV